MRLFLAALLLIIYNFSASAQKFSVLGDSSSTFKGAVFPDTNLVWYPEGGKNDVRKLSDTWVSKFAEKTGFSLDKNNSYSGSTICNTGYGKADYSARSFLARAGDLGNPDLILVFGATNDSWANSPIGEYKYLNFSKKDLYSFRPALACLCEKLKQTYKGKKIVLILNSELKDVINQSVTTIAKHYDLPVVVLHDIDKQRGHPSCQGMTDIATQVAEVVKGFW